MTLNELLRHLRYNLLRDVTEPHLWGVDEMTRVLNEAQGLFARRTHILTDDSSDLTVLKLKPGKPRYQLDPRIIHVLEVRDDTGRLLMDRRRRQLPRSLGEGKPLAYTLGSGASSIRVSPAPDDEYEYEMLVARRPKKGLTMGHEEPEIPEEYHLTLCDWAAYRLLRNNDAEGANADAAEGFMVEWERAVIEAKRDAMRWRMGSNPNATRNWTGARR